MKKIINRNIIVFGLSFLSIYSCKKTNSNTQSQPSPIVGTKPQANFTYFFFSNFGNIPDTVIFTSTSIDAISYKWDFGDGNISLAENPQHIYTAEGTYNVKLIVSNQYGADSNTKSFAVILKAPTANFNFTTSSLELMPVTITCNNLTTGSNVSYLWSFGNGSTSTQLNPINNYTSGGIYSIKLQASNSSGTDSMVKEIKICPYNQAYKTFNNDNINLFAWEGDKVVILSRNNSLNRQTMFKWAHTMDSVYLYYKSCTGQDPILFTPYYYINGRSTIADVANTCGAGCGYLGWTGIELQNTYFDISYNAINNNNQFDQALFYEFGRNFWLYPNQLAYKTNDPVTTGYAVFMRFMAMEATHVNGAPFGSLSFTDFKNQVIGLIDLYLSNSSLTWANTLGVGQGVPGGFGGGADLFASFCFRLKRDYGGDAFVQNVWKKAGQRPTAVTTQDAVDNFFLASCAAANRNLTSVFQSWRWPLSTNAIASASQYP